MKIRVFNSQDENLLFESSYIEIESYSKTAVRKFEFYDITSGCDMGPISDLYVEISVFNKKKEEVFLDGFGLHIVRDTLLVDEGGNYVVEGLMIFDSDFWTIYDQNKVDVFHDWDKIADIKKNVLMKRKSYKAAYIEASRMWSGLPKQLLENITVDCLYIIDYEDIFIILANSMVGFKSYIGRDLFTFEDCLIDIKNTRNRNIVIENLDRLNFRIKPIILEIIQVLKKYNYEVKIF